MLATWWGHCLQCEWNYRLKYDAITFTFGAPCSKFTYHSASGLSTCFSSSKSVDPPEKILCCSMWLIHVNARVCPLLIPFFATRYTLCSALWIHSHGCVICTFTRLRFVRSILGQSLTLCPEVPVVFVVVRYCFNSHYAWFDLTPLHRIQSFDTPPGELRIRLDLNRFDLVSFSLIRFGSTRFDLRHLGDNLETLLESAHSRKYRGSVKNPHEVYKSVFWMN